MRQAALMSVWCLITAVGLAGWQAAVNPSAANRSGSRAKQAAAKPRSSRPATTANKSPAGRDGANSATGRRTARSATKSKAQANRARLQQEPTPERYAEIQRALIERGYLAGPATGSWGPESVEALKRFQQDHNLDATGKINALTLIALGLGPNRASHTAGAPSALSDGQSTGEKP